jgi:hypothetical protein
MSKATFHNQIFLRDGNGNLNSISTGAFISPGYLIEEKRRLSLTIGQAGPVPTGLPASQPGPLTGFTGGLAATGTWQPIGGFTGILLIQGTNEVGQAMGATGTAWAGVGVQPGVNGYTGGLYWNTLPSGTVNITNLTTSLQIDFTDIGASWFRVVFNQPAPVGIQTGTGGSGTMQVYFTAKNT